MKSVKMNLHDIDTVGKLRELLKDIPDEAELSVYNCGDSGYIDGAEMEIIKYDNEVICVDINVKAESGYY